MATVKLQNDRVILKDGKVSCSCCEAGCCMYSAQKLANGIYSADDLPDSVILNYGLDENFELTRSGAEFLGGIYKLALGTLPNSTKPQWLLYVNNIRSSNNSCLITGDGGLTPGNNIIEDKFEDTYYLSATFLPPYEYFSFSNQPLFRTSLCSWISGYYGLYYYPFGRDFWLVTFPGIDGTGSNQRLNTPVGQYANRFGATDIFISE